MLSGATILRVSALLVLAGCLAALVQFLLPRPATGPAPEAPRSASSAAPAPRRIDAPPQANAAPPKPASEPPPAPRADPPPAPRPQEPVTPPVSPPVPPPAAEPPPRIGELAVETPDAAAGARAPERVDLNTASVADLNRLRGGSIGRAIVQGRPYATVDQLLSKRVLSRATYEKIKDQVTVR